MSTRVDATVGKHAFLVMAPGTMRVLHTLMRILDDGRNDIFIHMDAKRVDGMNIACWLLSVRQGIFLVPRIRVTWGGYSQIACEINLLNSAVAKGHYSYYHLLSGQDLPIKSQDKIHSFFDSCGNKEGSFALKTTTGTIGEESVGMLSGTLSG